MKGRRETNTMPQWAGSCWYYLRYIDAGNSEAAFDPEIEKYWMPVDLYIGGAEHAVLHLLYARFWHKVLYDLGIVSVKEPFQKLFNQGMILAVSYKNKAGFWVGTDLVVDEKGEPVPSNMELDSTKKYFHKDTGEELEQMAGKMSKSLSNVVNPDDIVKEFGADSLRLYEMFMGALADSKLWITSSINGINKFLTRCHKLVVNEEGELNSSITDDAELSEESRRTLHATIKKVGEDIESFGFNTAISQMMIFINEFSKLKSIPKSAIEDFVTILSPFAPHLAEELWEKLGHNETIAYVKWPEFNEDYLKLSEVEILVQVLGKPVKKLMVAADCDAKKLEAIALEDTDVKSRIKGKTVRKVIAVPGRLVNIVAT